MGIKIVPQPLYSPDLAPCDFWLFPKLSGCRYETIEEMKGAVTKVINMLIQEDFHGAFQKYLERYNKCITAGRDTSKKTRVQNTLMCTINKSAHTKKSGNLSYASRTLSYKYFCFNVAAKSERERLLHHRKEKGKINKGDLIFVC